MSYPDAIRVLQQAVGAEVLAVTPNTSIADPLPDGRVIVWRDVTDVTGFVLAPPLYVEPPLEPAGCCGGWTSPTGQPVVCTDCPGMLPDLVAPYVTGCDEQFCGADGGVCPGCGIDGADLRPSPDPVAVAVLAAPLSESAEQPTVREPRPAVVATGRPAQLVAPAHTPPADTEPLRVELTEAVMAYCLNDPRTLQATLGPSEIGHPCDARIIRKALELHKFNDRADPWASFVGQAVHAKLADVFEWANAQNVARDGEQATRYLVENRVWVIGDGTDAEDIGGSADLFRDGTVVDHKIVGNDTMRELKSAGWQAKGGIYSTQLDLYGYGFERAGHEVRDVALAAWPRSGFLAGLHVMRRPYDRAAAERALARLGDLVQQGLELDAANEDAPWQDIIATAPSKQCAFCPWYDPDRAVPNGQGGYDPRADRVACGFGRLAETRRGRS